MRGRLPTSEIFMPEAANKWTCGSSWGWLVLIDTNGVDLSLLNPLTRHVIQLPSANTFTPRSTCLGEPNFRRHGCYFIRRAILSANPITSKQDCFVIAILEDKRQLSYCRIGDTSWTNVENCLNGLRDVIYHEGTIYATNVKGVLMSFDITDPNSVKIVAIGFCMQTHVDKTTKHLAMVSGCLVLISRLGNNIKIYSLNRLNSSFIQKPLCIYLQIANEVEIWHEWVEKDSIGDYLLFFGNNCSFSLPAGMYDGMTNCIFFTKDVFGGLVCDYTGVYDVAKKYICSYDGYIQNKHSLFWVTPSPW